MRTKETEKRLKALTAYDNNAISILQWYKSAGDDSTQPFDFDTFVKDINVVFDATKSIIEDFELRQKLLFDDERHELLSKEIKEWSNIALNCGNVKPLLELALEDNLTFENVCNCLFGWTGANEALVSWKDIKKGTVAVLVYARLKTKYSQPTKIINNAHKEPQPQEYTQLRTGLTKEQLTNLCNLLKNGNFIDSNTDRDNFIWAFGGNSTSCKCFEPIAWIASTKQNNGYFTSKGALLELLRLLKVSFAEMRNKALLAKLFIDKDRKTLKFSTKNLNDAESNNYNSEYHNELTQIVDSME